MKRRFLFIVLTLASLTFFGFYQLNYQNMVISDSLTYSCNTGQCHTLSCSYNDVSVGWDSGVTQSPITCQMCMDFIAESSALMNPDYSGPSSTYCVGTCSICGGAAHYNGEGWTCSTIHTLTLYSIEYSTTPSGVYAVNSSSYDEYSNNFNCGTSMSISALSTIWVDDLNKYYYFDSWSDGNSNRSRAINTSIAIYAVYKDSNGVILP